MPPARLWRRTASVAGEPLDLLASLQTAAMEIERPCSLRASKGCAQASGDTRSQSEQALQPSLAIAPRADAILGGYLAAKELRRL